MKKDDYLKIQKTIPQLSGVYTFRDKSKRPLYIGKAKNLTNRVKSYFYGPKTSMISRMLLNVSTLTWQETLSEIEALILESAGIKKYRPPFNTLLRDDKQYFYVGFTKEHFPKLIITHQPQSLKVESIGPFTDGSVLKLALKTLRRIFPYCTCKQKHLNYCLNYHIGNCLGFCCLKNPTVLEPRSNEYRKNIKNIKDILNGKKNAVIKKMINQLPAGDQSELSSKVSKLQKFFMNTHIIHGRHESHKILLDMRKCLALIHLPVRIEGYDISNISGVFGTGSMVVFTDGRPDKNEYRKFKIKTVSGANDTAMLREVLERRLKHPDWPLPQLMVVDGSKGQVNTSTSVLKKMSIDIPVVGIIKNEKHFGERLLLGKQNKIINLETLPIGIKNLLLQIDSEAHRFAIAYYHKRHSFKK